MDSIQQSSQVYIRILSFLLLTNAFYSFNAIFDRKNNAFVPCVCVFFAVDKEKCLKTYCSTVSRLLLKKHCVLLYFILKKSNKHLHHTKAICLFNDSGEKSSKTILFTNLLSSLLTNIWRL